MPSFFQFALISLLCVVALPAVAAERREDYESCATAPPIVTDQIPNAPLSDSSIGEWWMPLSNEQPQVITHAKTQLEVAFDPEISSWVVTVNLTFFDPAPYGLPYTFYALKLLWTDSTGAPRELELDWTHACNDAGLSLYPGQKARFKLALGLSQSETALKNLALKIWGMRI